MAQKSKQSRTALVCVPWNDGAYHYVTTSLHHQDERRVRSWRWIRYRVKDLRLYLGHKELDQLNSTSRRLSSAFWNLAHACLRFHHPPWRHHQTIASSSFSSLSSFFSPVLTSRHADSITPVKTTYKEQQRLRVRAAEIFGSFFLWSYRMKNRQTAPLKLGPKFLTHKNKHHHKANQHPRTHQKTFVLSLCLIQLTRFNPPVFWPTSLNCWGNLRIFGPTKQDPYNLPYNGPLVFSEGVKTGPKRFRNWLRRGLEK